MEKPLRKLPTILLFLLLFWLAGYFREWMFVSVNNLIYYKYNQVVNPRPLNALLKFLDTFDYLTLYYLKYFMTFFFGLIFLMVQYFFLKSLKAAQPLTRMLVLIYLVLFVVSGITMGLGYLFNSDGLKVEYTISRWLLGVAQSPIICLFLLAAARLLPSNIPYEKR